MFSVEQREFQVGNKGNVSLSFCKDSSSSVVRSLLWGSHFNVIECRTSSIGEERYIRVWLFFFQLFPHTCSGI